MDSEDIQKYLASNVAQLPELTATLISVNDKPVLKGSMVWHIADMQNRIDNATLG